MDLAMCFVTLLGLLVGFFFGVACTLHTIKPRVPLKE
jgi:hypothetical protein